ncbi:undecaprenyl-phosphate glucose phosphotransferase [Amphritea sp. HPY]|uniref:undecaprenyl-phosphate glucose phosphotransferase n=1 Tax=Amphritea sp. HPY TaxID=3421652 RepID=UPI003D7C77DD
MDVILPHRRRLLKNYKSLTLWFQLAADTIAISVSLVVLTLLKLQDVPDFYQLLAVIAVLCMWIVYPLQGVYRRSSAILSSVYRLGSAWLITLLMLVFIGFITKTSVHFSREVLLGWALVGGLWQALNLVLFSYFYKNYRHKFSTVVSSLVIGTGALSRKLVNDLNGNNWLPDKVIGHVLGSDEPLDDDQTASFVVPVLGRLEALRIIIKENDIRRVYVALPINESKVIEGISFDLLDMNVDVIWVPNIFALNLLNHSVREIGGIPLIFLNETPLISSKGSIFIKNLMDKLLALIALIVLSPLMLVIALLIKKSSRGPVFFKQARHGWDGKVIEVWKFRSMIVHSDDSVTQAVKDDLRVTDIGAFIRRTSIDEIPQFINVLQGQMSLVGPRPHAIAHNDYYSGKVDAYLGRHRIKPGITGLAQVSGYRGETDSIEKMVKRVELDLKYINSWSLLLDLKILIKTPLSLLSKDIY